MVDVSKETVSIHDAVQRHATQLEYVDLLPIKSGHGMIGVRQANERDAFILPVAYELGRRVRANRKDLYLTGNEIRITIP